MEGEGSFHWLSSGASVVIWVSGPADWLLGPRLWWRSRQDAGKIPMEQRRDRGEGRGARGEGAGGCLKHFLKRGIEIKYKVWGKMAMK